MKKYYENLDDYTDHSPSKFLEIVELVLPAVIFVAAMLVILGTCGSLEVM